MNEIKLASLALLLAVAIAPRAHAQEWTRQSFLLPKAGFELTGSPARPDLMRINMSRNSAFKPVEFPVNFFWGISNKVMIHIGGMLRFPNALGKNNTLDWRELTLLGQFRF